MTHTYKVSKKINFAQMFIISGNSGSLAILNVDKWNENREIYIMEVLFLLLIFQVSGVCQDFQQTD